MEKYYKVSYSRLLAAGKEYQWLNQVMMKGYKEVYS